ncbi:MAG: HAD family hydrolase [Candidatus Odinarchaeota archaeon]
MIRAVSFDFDDTLAGNFPPVHQAFYTLLRRKKIKIKEENVNHAFLEVMQLFRTDTELERKVLKFARYSSEELLAFYNNINLLRLEKLNLGLEKPELMDLASWITLSFPNVSTKQVFDDVPGALLELRLFHEDLLIYVISGNNQNYIQDLLEKEGLMIYIKQILTPEKEGMRKRDLFKIELKKTGIQPRQWLHVGDDFHSDHLYPSELNIRTLLLQRPKLLHLPVPEDQRDRVQIIESLHQIYDFL